VHPYVARRKETGQTAEAHSPLRVQISEIRKLVAWLQEFDVQPRGDGIHAHLLEAVWNVLESHFQIVPVNAQHIKPVSSHKLNTKD
jgi:hypothetical protein